MAKIAQMDDLVIEITGGISDATDAQKKKLAQCVKANTILDVVLKTTTEGVTRIVGYNVSEGTTTVTCVDASTGALETLTVEAPAA